jgi:CMP-N-acetylneuraminic acid synthetase
MLQEVVIIIPARGGSVRLPRKNMAPLRGKPLLAYTLEQVQEAKLSSVSYVSTEDAEIRSLAERAGLVVIDRPPDLADEAASTEAVLLHALDVLARRGVAPSWVMTLPPTSPFRKAETIHRFLEEAGSVGDEVDCLFSVSETAADFWRMERGELRRMFPDAPRSQRKRQERGEILFEENSAIYITRVAALRACMDEGALAPLLGRRVRGITIDPLEAFDINTPLDLMVAEAMLERL